VVADAAFARVGIVVVAFHLGAVLREPCFEPRHDAFVSLLFRGFRAGFRDAEENGLLRFVGQLAPRRVGIDPERGDRARKLGGETDGCAAYPREDLAFTERAFRIADDSLGIDDDASAQAVTRGTRAVRSVERKHARLDRRKRDAAIDARESFAEPERLFAFD